MSKIIHHSCNHPEILYKLKSEFILQVIHELRSPVAVIEGFHEMILKGITGKINTKTKKTLEKANHRIKNLLLIIDELIDHASINSKQIKIKRTDLEIINILEDIKKKFRELTDKKKIKIDIDCDPSLRILTDKDLMIILLNNIISNAIIYSPEKSTITVKAYHRGPYLNIVINDQGIGISKEEENKIFEEFYRTRRARKIEKDGTGLGLSIVKQAVNILKGSIKINSKLNKGTQVHVTLPIRR